MTKTVWSKGGRKDPRTKVARTETPETDTSLRKTTIFSTNNAGTTGYSRRRMERGRENLHIGIKTIKNADENIRGCRDVSEVKDTCYSFKGSRFDSQHTHGRSQPSATLVPGDPMAFCGHLAHRTHVVHRYAGKINTQNKINKITSIDDFMDLD